MNDKEHISKEDFYRFQHNLLNQSEKELFLEHLCSCDYCSDQFAALVSEEIMEAPKDMKENILKAVKRPEIQLAVSFRESSKRMQLFLYSLKVGTATAVALLILIFSMNISELLPSFQGVPNVKVTASDRPEEYSNSITAEIRNKMKVINTSILNFSNNIIKTEETKHD